MKALPVNFRNARKKPKKETARMPAPVLAPTDITPGVFSGTPSHDVAVSVRGLSKSYSIARNAEQHSTMGEALMHKLRHPFQQTQRDTFWALNDVSFDIQKGDVVGIIGRNGAGKSTLLKILSRITEPTRGKIDLYGRVGSLLEVGTGFHPELTGRENIYLNGAILGMTKGEIARQFDAIVDFSGTEQFLDTPVKRYSSGMYVRLAFAVAAHLNPEILIIDEVLAVGDSEFQMKCLGKMQDVADSGRTVLFVSHNMTSVLQLCNKCIFLDHGKIVSIGSSTEIVTEYIEHGLQMTSEVCWKLDEAPGNETVKISTVRALNQNSAVCGDYMLSESITLEMDFWCGKQGMRLNPSFHVLNIHGTCVFATANMHDKEWMNRRYAQGFYRARCVIPKHLLNDGQYRVSAFIMEDLHRIPAQAHEAISFVVNDDGSSRGDYTNVWIGLVRPLLPWQIEALRN